MGIKTYSDRAWRGGAQTAAGVTSLHNSAGTFRWCAGALLSAALLAGCRDGSIRPSAPSPTGPAAVPSPSPRAVSSATPDPAEQLLQGELPSTVVPTPTRPPVEAPASPTPESVAPEPIALLEPGEPVNLLSIDMLDVDRGWGISGAGEADQHVLRTEDGGRTWFDVSPPVLTHALENCGIEAYGRFDGPASAWVGYSSGADPGFSDCRIGAVTDLWRTEDAGASWRLSSFVQRNVDTYGDTIGSGFPLLEFVDPLNGWAWRSFFLGASSSAYELHHTDDGGRTWRLLPDGYLFRVTGIDFLDRRHGWATISYPQGFSPQLSLGQSHDGGMSWDRGALPLPDGGENLSNCRVHSPVLRSASAGELTVECLARDFAPAWYRYQTTDGGRNWRIQSIPPQPEQYLSAQVGWKLEAGPDQPQSGPDSQACVLSWTRDGGRSWLETGTLACESELDFVSNQVGWALSTVSQGSSQLLRTADGGRSWQPLEPVTAAGPIAGERPAPPRLLPVGERPEIAFQSAGELRLLQEVPVAGVSALASHPGRDVLLTAHRDGTVTFWQPLSGGYGRVARLHGDWIYDAAVMPVFDRLATASRDGHLRFWRLYGNGQGEDFSGLGGEVAAVAASSRGVLFASAGQDHTVRLWEYQLVGVGAIEVPEDGPHQLRGHRAWVWDVSLSPEGDRLASGSADRTVRIWDTASGETVAVLTAHQATVGALGFSPDGSLLASAAWDGSLVLWDAGSWEPRWTNDQVQARVYSLSFSSDGSLLATGTGDGILRLWSTQSGELVAELPLGDVAVRSVLFTPDGKLLVAASDDGLLRLWGVGP